MRTWEETSRELILKIITQNLYISPYNLWHAYVKAVSPFDEYGISRNLQISDPPLANDVHDLFSKLIETMLAERAFVRLSFMTPGADPQWGFEHHLYVPAGTMMVSELPQKACVTP